MSEEKYIIPNELWSLILEHTSFFERKRLWKVCRLFASLITRWKNVKLRVASFDIGKTNFAQYVEEFLLDDIFELKEIYLDLPPNKQRRTKGKMSDEILFILDTLYRKANRINIGVFDFTSGNQNKLTNDVLKKFLKHMYSYQELWKTCDVFIIEQQFVNLFGRNRGINMDAIKLAAGLKTWLIDHHPSKSIQSFGSQYKTQILGAPTKLKKPERKKWSVMHTEDLFTRRDDKEILKCFQLARDVKGKRIRTEERVQSFLIDFVNAPTDILILAEKIIRIKQKLDDISDVVLQLQAYKYRTFIAQF